MRMASPWNRKKAGMPLIMMTAQGPGHIAFSADAPTVRMFLHFEYPRGQYWFSSARWQAKTAWLTLQGPGRVAIQSVFEPPEMVGQVTNCSAATTQYW